ncbi:MAG: nucleotidyltransferase domain-containing protein, partial [Xanthomonadales bacterium]|nr:nucleotidyltransferase domain-containing protein [Xanthomonadales bacterium]
MSSSPPTPTTSPSAARIADALSAAGDDAQWLALAREALEHSNDGLGADFERGMDIDRLLARRARDVDAVLVAAWQRALPDDSPACLIATGGYGRGELFPESDIDLLVLVEPEAEPACRDGIEGFFATLWDIGLSPGHALRSLRQCAELAAEDLTVVTALMEARLLAGSKDAFDALLAAVSPVHMWPPADYFRAKRQEQIERHARYNDTAYNLEPNLKDGPGGLRDVQTLLWMARRLLGRGGLAAFAASGALGEDEFGTLERERRALSRLRYGLHRVAGRREERLLFEHQTSLAKLFGYEDRHRENLAVEQLMQGFYRSAALVLRLNSRILQRFEEHLAAASGEGREAPITLGDGFEIRRGYLAVDDVSRFRREPLSILRLFQAWQQHSDVSALHSETARALGEALDVVGDHLDGDPEAAREFMAIVRGPGAVEQLSRMARLGVLGRYLPAFGRVSGRMQFDLF